MAKGKKEAELKFEEALKRLNEIVHQLEDEEVELDNALKLFEEGVKLSDICKARLEEADKKVKVLLKDKKGNVKIEDLDDEIDEEEPLEAEEEEEDDLPF
jgi:exodeoxyribonuclease VII small subunit